MDCATEGIEIGGRVGEWESAREREGEREGGWLGMAAPLVTTTVVSHSGHLLGSSSPSTRHAHYFTY